ncbi:MAG: pitrilysin family protein [Phycisphaerae bacterium]|jgi:zinc protease
MSRKVSWFLGIGLVFCCVVSAEATRRYDYRKVVLDNGLTVITLEDHSCPIVAVQVWYHVGSKNEDPERQGFAHMFEHMMFRGTDRLGPEEHFESIRGTGGSCNAYTSFDNTTYVNELPSNQLELALWLEAERMAFLKIDDEGFYTERNVVEEERRMRSLNAPYGTVMEKVLPVLFTKHPYRWSTIGQIPHLRAATIEELQAFWDKYYVPSNATLVIVGDVTHDHAQTLARKYFSWLPRCAEPEPLGITEPPQTEPRSVTIPEKKGPAPIVGLLYRGVPMGHKDEVAAEMLMSILGDGESSRIYKDVVKDQKIAQVAIAAAVSLEDDGLLAAGAVLMPWGNKQRVLKVMREHITRVKADGVTDKELEKAKNQYLRNEITQTLTVARKAGLLGRYETLEGDVEKANTRLAGIRAVTRDDIRRVANLYLTRERETEGIVQPKIGSMFKKLLGFGKEEDVDEGAAPVDKPEMNRVATRGGCRAALKHPSWYPDKPPIAPLTTTVPEIEHHKMTLDNGLTVVVVPNHEVPFVTMKLGVLHGSWTDLQPGVASLAASMITQGSAEHTAAEMAEELEFNAISLSGGASMDVGSVNASCVTDKVELAAKLLAEVVQTPTFPDDQFEIMRQQVLLGLMVQAKTPEYIADREFRRRLFGPHPYARTSTGEPEEVRALTTSDLKRWWGTFVRPNKATLYLAGDVTPATAFTLAKAYFGGWKNETPEPSIALPDIPEPADTHIYIVDRPGSVQSQIRVGHVGITRRDEGYFSSRVLSQIFGGSFSSRLNKAIRVEKGLTYGARGGLYPNRFAGRFTISTFTKTPSTAETVRVILDEIDRIRKHRPEQEEVDTAKAYLVGSFAGDRETPQATVSDLWLIQHDGLPPDYLNRYLEGIKKTGGKDVQRDAKRFMARDKLTVVVVGEAEKIKGDLEKIAPVTVVAAAAEDAETSDPDGS